MGKRVINFKLNGVDRDEYVNKSVLSLRALGENLMLAGFFLLQRMARCCQFADM